MNRDSESCAYSIHAFVRFSLYRHRTDRHAEKFRKSRTDCTDMRTQLRHLAYYRGIDIAHDITDIVKFGNYGRKKCCGVGPFPARISVGEMRSNVPKRRRTENGIDHGMNENIRIGMSFQLRTIRNYDSTQLLRNVRTATLQAGILEPVRIISETNSHAPYTGKPPSNDGGLEFHQPILMCIPLGGSVPPDWAADAVPTVIAGFADCPPPFLARGGPIRQLWTRPSVRGACSTKHSS